jgi:hypothetical protein
MDRINRFRHLVIPAAIALVGLLPAKARAQAPTTTFNPTQPGTGFVVCAGQANPITFTATSPGGGNVTVNTTGTVPAFVTFTPTLGTAAASPVTEAIAVNPPAGSTGTFTFNITSTNAAGTTTTPVTLNVDRPPTVTLSQGGTAVTQPSGGFTAVVGKPFILDVTTTDPDATDTVSLGVATSTNGGPNVAGPPAGGVQNPNLIGSDTAGPNGSDLLGTTSAGGSFTTRLTFTPSAAEAGSTFVVNYIAKDSRGCVTTLPVTIKVVNPAPTTITVTSTPDVTTTLITPDQQVCFTSTVVDQVGNPVAGATVTFNLTGGPFNNVTVNGSPVLTAGPSATATVTGTTDALGHAVVCFTPLFPGSVGVTATSGAATIVAPTTTVVVVSTPGAYVSGQGVIDTAPGTAPPIPGRFSMDLRSRTNGTFAGALDLVQPGTRGRILRARTTSITGIVINTISSQAGRRASIFGTIFVTGLGVVPFRADAVDASTPGTPGDSLVITLAVPGVPPIVIGGNLLFYQGDPGFRGYDISIRSGIPTGGNGGLGGGIGGGNGGGGSTGQKK